MIIFFTEILYSQISWEQRKLGDVIEQCLEKNTDMLYGINDAIGVTLTKEMIPTYANMDESTDVSSFYASITNLMG